MIFYYPGITESIFIITLMIHTLQFTMFQTLMTKLYQTSIIYKYIH